MRPTRNNQKAKRTFPSTSSSFTTPKSSFDQIPPRRDNSMRDETFGNPNIHYSKQIPFVPAQKPHKAQQFSQPLSFDNVDRMSDDNIDQPPQESQFSKQVTPQELNTKTDLMCKYITLSNLLALLELYFEKTGSIIEPKYRNYLLQSGIYTTVDVLVLIDHIEMSLLSLTFYVKDKSIKEDDLVNFSRLLKGIAINRNQTAIIHLIDCLRFGLLSPESVLNGCTIARKLIPHYNENKVMEKPSMHQLSDSIQSFSFVKECSKNFVMDNVENINDKPSNELKDSYFQQLGTVLKKVVGWDQGVNHHHHQHYHGCGCYEDTEEELT